MTMELSSSFLYAISTLFQPWFDKSATQSFCKASSSDAIIHGLTVAASCKINSKQQVSLLNINILRLINRFYLATYLPIYLSFYRCTKGDFR